MIIEKLSADNIFEIASLAIEMWPESSYDDELKDARDIFTANTKPLSSFAKIILALWHDYVEGMKTSPVAYIEGIYIQPEVRKQGHADTPVRYRERGAINLGCSEMGSDA